MDGMQVRMSQFGSLISRMEQHLANKNTSIAVPTTTAATVTATTPSTNDILSSNAAAAAAAVVAVKSMSMKQLMTTVLDPAERVAAATLHNAADFYSSCDAQTDSDDHHSSSTATMSSSKTYTSSMTDSCVDVGDTIGTGPLLSLKAYSGLAATLDNSKLMLAILLELMMLPLALVALLRFTRSSMLVRSTQQR
jgi:ABC-type glycerol-3-phosphate transport system permease component